MPLKSTERCFSKLKEVVIEDDAEPEIPPIPEKPPGLERSSTVIPNKVIHNSYLNQRKMAYTRSGYEERHNKYAELFKNAF